jgi:hypothetical protein
MKIIEIARGHITVEVEGRTLKIGGEGFVREFSKGDPNFVDYVIYLNTLTAWNKPWDREAVPNQVKQDIIAFLKQDFANRKLKLAIE